MKNTCTHLLALVLVALMIVPVFAADTNATNTSPTSGVTETTTSATTTTVAPATTETVSETTVAPINTTTTVTAVTTESVNATTATTAPVTTAVTTVSGAAEDTLGEITAASSPLGAALLIDGAYYGTTPVTLNNIPVGNHIVRLTLSGYYDYEGSIYVTPDKVTNVFGTLQPVGSSVAIITPAATNAEPVATVTVQATQTSAGGIFDSPTVIAAIIGIITACIGAGATIFTHIAKTKKE